MRAGGAGHARAAGGPDAGDGPREPATSSASGTALREIHRPASREELAPGPPPAEVGRGIRRTADARAAQAPRGGLAGATPAPREGGLLAAFDAGLPYELTGGQRAVGDEIAADLARPHPMHRLLQGEVGSGKTVCALRAMLQVVDAGGQAALLAPTEVLAAQHHRSIGDLLGPLGRAGELDGDRRRAPGSRWSPARSGAAARRRGAGRGRLRRGRAS